MSKSIMENISSQYHTTHERVLKAIVESSEDQFAWRPNSRTPSIGFHLWHLARWADYLQELINGAGSQIWDKEGLAARWGFDPSLLGYAETGMGMDVEKSAMLSLPSKEVLLDYACRVFTITEQSVSTITDDRYFEECQYRTDPDKRILGSTIVGWLGHNNRHLGMIQSMRAMMATTKRGAKAK
jgi:hypothetical protein